MRPVILTLHVAQLLSTNGELSSRNHRIIRQIFPAIGIHLVIQLVVRILRIVLHFVHSMLTLGSAQLDREHVPGLHLAIDLLILVHKWVGHSLITLLAFLHLGGHHARIHVSSDLILRALFNSLLTSLSKHTLSNLLRAIIDNDLPLDSARTDFLDLLELDGRILFLELSA